MNWSRAVKMFLKGQGKLILLIKLASKSKPVKVKALDQEDAQILQCSRTLEQNIAYMCQHVMTCKGLWQYVQMC